MKQVYKRIYLWVILGLAILPVAYPSPYLAYVFCLVGIYAMLSLGLGLLLGYAGQISLGHAGFFCIGAYSAAIMVTRVNLSPWLAIIASILITCFVAFTFCFPILKLRGYFLALATLGFGEIVLVLVNENRWLTNGPFGITQIPTLSVGNFEFDSYLKFYYLIWCVLGLMFLFSRNIVASREGMALRAISSSEVVASTLGIDTSRFKIRVFVLSAAFAGIAGCFYAFFMTAISTADFTVNLSLLIIMMVIVGGMRNLIGPIIGAFVLTGISEALNQYKEYSLSFYGFLLVVLLIFMPNGIYAGTADLSERIKCVFR
jgi:branched-chain amino acid transport system permease protein